MTIDRALALGRDAIIIVVGILLILGAVEITL